MWVGSARGVSDLVGRLGKDQAAAEGTPGIDWQHHHCPLSAMQATSSGDGINDDAGRGPAGSSGPDCGHYDDSLGVKTLQQRNRH